MIVYHQNNIAAFKGNQVFYDLSVISARITATSAGPTGRIMSSLAYHGGLAGSGGIAGQGGGLA